MLSGKPMGTSNLFSSFLLQQYRAESTVGGSASIVTYHTVAYRCALFTFFLKDLSVGGAFFLALNVFVYQDIHCTKNEVFH